MSAASSTFATTEVFVFTFSSFGGTVVMGALMALTLHLAVAANLLLLPALLFRIAP